MKMIIDNRSSAEAHGALHLVGQMTLSGIKCKRYAWTGKVDILVVATDNAKSTRFTLTDIELGKPDPRRREER